MDKRAISVILTILLIGTYVVYLRGQNERLKRSEALSRQNLTAVTDTLRTVRKENGEIESARLVLVAEKEELEGLNESLARRVHRLRGELSVAIASNATVAAHDTVFVPVTDEIHTDSSRVWRWTYDPTLPPGNRLLVEGTSGIVMDSSFTKVTSHKIAIDMAFGIRKREDDLYEVVGTSTWPGLVLNVEGAVLEPDWIVPPKRRSWTLPFGIGVGLGVILWELVR